MQCTQETSSDDQVLSGKPRRRREFVCIRHAERLGSSVPRTALCLGRLTAESLPWSMSSCKRHPCQCKTLRGKGGSHACSLLCRAAAKHHPLFVGSWTSYADKTHESLAVLAVCKSFLLQIQQTRLQVLQRKCARLTPCPRAGWCSSALPTLSYHVKSTFA